MKIRFTSTEQALIRKLTLLDDENDIELTPEEAQLFGVPEADILPAEDLTISKPIKN